MFVDKKAVGISVDKRAVGVFVEENAVGIISEEGISVSGLCVGTVAVVGLFCKVG
jgi:hypothetical protein